MRPTDLAGVVFVATNSVPKVGSPDLIRVSLISYRIAATVPMVRSLLLSTGIIVSTREGYSGMAVSILFFMALLVGVLQNPTIVRKIR